MSVVSVSVVDNTDEIKKLMENEIASALEEIGIMAEGYAKIELSTPKTHADGTERPNVDTGRLRNSITHAVRMDGQEKAVYIGTNVEYAPYVEMGTSRARPYPYLRPAATNHLDEYKAKIEEYLKNAE